MFEKYDKSNRIIILLSVFYTITTNYRDTFSGLLILIIKYFLQPTASLTNATKLLV